MTKGNSESGGRSRAITWVVQHERKDGCRRRGGTESRIGRRGDQTRARGVDCAGDRREIFTRNAGWETRLGGCYEAGFVRRGVGAGTVFGNSWSWKGE